MTDSSPNGDRTSSCARRETVFPALSGDSNQNEILKSLSQQMLPERPKRPLSAYNIYFRETRRKILQNIPDVKKKSKKTSCRGPHGKIGFADLARTIGTMWKAIEPKEQAVYNKLALADRKRYNREKAEWQLLMEEHRRNEEASLVEKNQDQQGTRASTTEDDSIKQDEDSSSRQEMIQKNDLSTKSSFLPTSNSCCSRVSKAGHSPGARTNKIQVTRPAVKEETILHELPPIMDAAMGSSCLAAIKRLKASGDTHQLAFLVGRLVKNSSSSTAESRTNPPSLTTKKNASSATHAAAPFMAHTMILNNPTSPHGHASFEGYCVRETSSKAEVDLFSPTITRGYTKGYSWLASHMGSDHTAFFIDMFRGE